MNKTIFAIVLVALLIFGCAQEKSVNQTKTDKNTQTANISISENLQIKENTSLEICNWSVAVDGIWIDHGKIKADMSVFQHGKPLQGGYSKGDKIEIGFDENKCEYYVKDIKKYGKEAGYAILTNKKTERTEVVCPAEAAVKETGPYTKLGDVEMGITTKGDVVIASLVIEGKIQDSFELHKGDNVWAGGCAYNVAEIVNGTAYLKNVKELYNSYEGPIIPGSEINAPPRFPK